MISLSVIIPIGKNDLSYKPLVDDLLGFAEIDEIILISTIGDPIARYQDQRIKKVESGNHRGEKINKGINAAVSDYIWILHADSKISLSQIEEIKHFCQQDKKRIGYFPLKFHDSPIPMFVTEWGVYLRSILLKVPFGDQGLIFHRSVLSLTGPFDEQCRYGEDHIFIWKARLKQIDLQWFRSPIGTSARKYINNGWTKTTRDHLYLTWLQAAPFIKQLFQAKI